jgi:flagellar hook-length control protein FliK
MRPIQPNPAPLGPPPKTNAPRDTPATGAFETFLTVFGDGGARSLGADNGSSIEAPNQTDQAGKATKESESQLVKHAGEEENSELASEGRLIAVPLGPETAARPATTKPHTPGSETPGTQDPARHFVADTEQSASTYTAQALTRGAPTPDKQVATGQEQSVDGGMTLGGIAPSEAPLKAQNQSLSKPDTQNDPPMMRPLQGQDGPSAVTDTVHPKADVARMIPQDGKTGPPAWTTVPQAPTPKVESAAHAGSRTAQAEMVKTAPNSATPSAASVGGMAPQVMSDPTPARPSLERSAREVSATNGSIPDRPVAPHSATAERGPQNPVITPSLGNGSAATSPPSLGAPIPTITPDPGEDHRRAIDPAPPDIRFAAEAVSRPGIQTSQVSQTPDLPRHVAHQMAEAVHRNGGDRGVDLLLNPAELGRVRISLSPSDAGMTVQILADRPETLDLIRRNIDLLAQDFQSLGYEATDFAFAQQQNDAESGPRQNPPSLMENLDAETSEMADHTRTSIMTDRVDIRL